LFFQAVRPCSIGRNLKKLSSLTIYMLLKTIRPGMTIVSSSGSGMLKTKEMPFTNIRSISPSVWRTAIADTHSVYTQSQRGRKLDLTAGAYLDIYATKSAQGLTGFLHEPSNCDKNILQQLRLSTPRIKGTVVADRCSLADEASF
jgi:hypothetical protein